jgi:hypothetical protein
MKSLNLPAVVLALAAFTLFSSANQSAAGQREYSRSSDGVLRMKHSPVLGINIPIAVWIDGVQAGVFAKGHVYERYLTPGRHDLFASRPTRMSDSWRGTLDVRPGETYSFVVSCTPGQVILQPVSRVD